MTNEELTVQAKQGDQEAMLQLWTQVERLVRMKARHRLPNDGSTSRFDIDDLMQAGYLAMVAAVKDFDPVSGYKFATYLNLHLKNAFNVELGIKTTRRDALLQAVSLDKPIGEDDESTLAGTLEDPSAEMSFENMLERANIEQAFCVVEKHFSEMDPDNVRALRLYYLEDLSMRQVGECMKITASQARSLIAKGLRELRGFGDVRKIGQELFADERTNFFLRTGLTAFQNGTPSAVERLTEQREAIVCRIEDMRNLGLPDRLIADYAASEGTAVPKLNWMEAAQM